MFARKFASFPCLASFWVTRAWGRHLCPVLHSYEPLSGEVAARIKAVSLSIHVSVFIVLQKILKYLSYISHHPNAQNPYCLLNSFSLSIHRITLSDNPQFPHSLHQGCTNYPKIGVLWCIRMCGPWCKKCVMACITVQLQIPNHILCQILFELQITCRQSEMAQ